MPWFERDYGSGSCQPEFDKFESLFLSLGGPRGMMMLSCGRVTKTIVYISLPNSALATEFPGFEPTEKPVSVDRGLIGHDEEMGEYLPKRAR